MKLGLTFDDVLLVPKKGQLNKRVDADLSSELFQGVKIDLPIISANMPAVTGIDMAEAMYNLGGLGALPRIGKTIEEAAEEFKQLQLRHATAIVSLGLHDGLERAQELIKWNAKFFCLDIAHGHSTQAYNFVKEFRTNFGHDIKLIVGNIATFEAAAFLATAGANAIKIGIGPGAACRTREVTGFGVPQLTAIMEVADARNKNRYNYKIIADGGIKNSGDIVKALAAGADTVMVGSLLAGCDEAPNPGEYYGNASEGVNGHRAPEGIHGRVERTGSVEDVIKELAWGIRSGVSYGGATNLRELRERAEFIQVTAAGQHEGSTRLNEPDYIEMYVDQIEGTKLKLAV